MGKRPVTAESLLEIPLVYNPAISPDGTRILYNVSTANKKENKYEARIWLYENGKTIPVTSGPGDSCPTWDETGTLAVFTRKTDKGVDIMTFKPGAGEPGRITRVRWGASSLVVDGGYVYFTERRPLSIEEWKDYMERDVWDIESIPIWFNGEGFIFDRRRGLFRAPLHGGQPEAVVHGPLDLVSYDVHNGRIAYSRIMEELRPYRHALIIREPDGEERTLLEGYTIMDVAWSRDGKLLAVKARDESRGFAGHFKVYLVDPETGEAECVTCGLDRNAAISINTDVNGFPCRRGLQWDDNRVYFHVADAGRVHLYAASPGSEPEPVILEEAAVVGDYSVSAGGHVAYTRMTPTSPKEVYLHDGGEPRRITWHTSNWLDKYSLGEPEHHRIRASDGEEIDVWVLRPEKPNGAWILYIHGGPKTMYGYGFIHEFHYLAAKGFTIVYSNPRGSDGYTEEFADIRGRYGERDYQDLMEVADYAVEKLGLDPGKAGVTGGSYGGFMTNWIITHTNRFKAAVTQRCCSNWISKYGTTDIGWYFNKDQIARGKRPWEDPEIYWEKSPLKHVANVKTPLLIIHSLEDYRCYIDQALQLFTALKELGVPTKLTLFPRETHDLSRTGSPRRRIARLERIAGWFEQHLLGGAGQG